MSQDSTLNAEIERSARTPRGRAAGGGRLRRVPAAFALAWIAALAAAAILIMFASDHLLAPALPEELAAAAILIPPALLAAYYVWRRRREGTAARDEGESPVALLARIAPMGVFQADATGQYLSVNARGCEIMGLGSREPLGFGWVKALHPEDRARVVEDWSRCVANGEPFRAEFRLLRREASVAWVSVRADALRNAEGTVLGYVGAIADVTKGKDNEKALWQTNRALRVLNEANMALTHISDESGLLHEICRIIVETGQYRMAWVGFAENDPDRTVRPAAKWGYDGGYLSEITVTWKERWGRLGPAAHAIHYKKPYVVRNVTTDPVFAPWRSAAMARGFASLIALPLIGPSGAFGILGLYASEPDAFDDAEVQLLDGLARNLAYGITAIRTRDEHMRATIEIRDSEERFRATFEQAAVGMAHLSPDGRFLRVNRKFCDITGYGRDELSRMSFQEITHPDDLPADMRQAERLLKGEISTYSVDKRYARRDGSLVWVNRTISLVRDSDGNPKYIISVIRDLTDARMMESQLRQAQKMEAVGQLTGGVAHDFNNLLTIVLGNLELLQERAEAGSDIHRLAERSIAAAERGASLTQRLLAFSRQQVLQPRATDVNDLVRNMYELLCHSLGETIRIKTDLAESPGLTMVDPVQLETALLNLAVNARDAMPRGGTLTIETAHTCLDRKFVTQYDEVVPGEYLLLSVSDTGVGMPQQVRERAFEPFFTTKEVGKGSGLGLSMVYGFVKQSGGHIGISSEPGKGTTVRIYLPWVPADAPESTEADIPDVTAARGESVLLVEDNAEIREISAEMLRDLGYAVVEAADAESALAIADGETHLDLLLTEVSLRGPMSGPELAREFKRRRPHAHVLFISGLNEGAVAAMSTDAATLLRKPFRQSELASQIRRSLAD